MALTKTQVSSLYVSLFGRTSEGGGNQYWVNMSNIENLSVSAIADRMLDTSVVKQYFGDNLNDNFKFINFIYENTLNKSAYEGRGKEVDKAGVEYWTRLLETKTKGEVVNAMIQSVYDPKYETLDAARLFKNKVILSDLTSDAIKDANINNLQPFIDAINSVNPNSTLGDIQKIVNDTQDKIGNFTAPIVNTNSWYWEGDKLVVGKDAVGMITIDKIPRSIKVEELDLISTTMDASFFTESMLLNNIIDNYRDWTGSLFWFEKGVVTQYRINDTRYLAIEKDGLTKFADNNKYHSPTHDLMIKIIDMPKDMDGYFSYHSEEKGEIALSPNTLIPPRPDISRNPNTVDKSVATKGYHWDVDVLVVDKNTTGLISIDKIPNAIKVEGAMLSAIVVPYDVYDSKLEFFNNAFENNEYKIKSIWGKGQIYEAQVEDSRYVYIDKDGFSTRGIGFNSYSPQNDLMIEIVGMPMSKMHYKEGYGDDLSEVVLV